jgi:hypothetical protein
MVQQQSPPQKPKSGKKVKNVEKNFPRMPIKVEKR